MCGWLVTEIKPYRYVTAVHPVPRNHRRVTTSMECCAARKGGGALRVPGIGFALGGGDDDAKVNKDFVTVGRGVGGVDELALSLDESAVQWGLVAQSVGSGAMARTKHVFVYFSGAKCPMVKRMRYTERRPAAVSALGGGGMIDWDREYVADVNLDEVSAWRRGVGVRSPVRRVCAADSSPNLTDPHLARSLV